VNGELKL